MLGIIVNPLLHAFLSTRLKCVQYSQRLLHSSTHQALWLLLLRFNHRPGNKIDIKCNAIPPLLQRITMHTFTLLICDQTTWTRYCCCEIASSSHSSKLEASCASCQIRVLPMASRTPRHSSEKLGVLQCARLHIRDRHLDIFFSKLRWHSNQADIS